MLRYVDATMVNPRKMPRQPLNFLPAMSAVKRWLLPSLALGWFAGAWAASLSDPTRPPPAWQALQPGATGAADQDAASGLRLTVVGRTRKFAIIDGQVVKPGDTYDGSKVLVIKSGEVVVQDNAASKSLKLTPGVEKKVIAPNPLKKSARPALQREQLLNGNGGRQ